MEMYNCHIHTFRDCDIPEKFLPLGLVRWLAKRDHKFLFWLAKNINPFCSNDTVDKYATFVKTGKMKSQKEILDKCSKFYPTGTKFIVLPMDMAFMGAGKVPRKYEEQLQELDTLSDSVIKFIHVDPRRPHVDILFRYKTEVDNYKGMKLYPPLGYYPFDSRLMSLYSYCESKNLPIIAHGSPGNPVHFKGSRKELYTLLSVDGNDPKYKKMSAPQLCSIFTHPMNYKMVLPHFPKLNFCIAHIGSSAWDEYLTGDISGDNWLSHIIELIHRYDNFWTDISFTLADERYWALFKVMMSSDDKLASRVLFGSDYYMNEIENDEREWSIKFRAFIGEELFRKIAVENPKVFLNLQ